MKTELTIEQSARLAELGVDPKMASGLTIFDDPVSQWTHRGKLIFTLTDLLAILPKEIDTNLGTITLSIIASDLSDGGNNWTACYIDKDIVAPFEITVFAAPELIDALYQLLIWCLEIKES